MPGRPGQAPNALRAEPATRFPASETPSTRTIAVVGTCLTSTTPFGASITPAPSRSGSIPSSRSTLVRRPTWLSVAGASLHLRQPPSDDHPCRSNFESQPNAGFREVHQSQKVGLKIVGVLRANAIDVDHTDHHWGRQLVRP